METHIEAHTMQSGYTILAQRKLVIEVLSGKANLSRIKTDRDLLYNDKNFHPEYKMIIDTRNVELHLNSDELSDYFNYVAKKEKILKKRETAFITSEDYKTALQQELKKYEKILPIRFYTFSDTGSCAKWLKDNTISKNTLDEIIFRLIKNPTHVWFKTPHSLNGF